MRAAKINKLCNILRVKSLALENQDVRNVFGVRKSCENHTNKVPLRLYHHVKHIVGDTLVKIYHRLIIKGRKERWPGGK